MVGHTLPECRAVEMFLAAVRTAAMEGTRRVLSVADDYEFDRSRWAAGPRRTLKLIALRVAVECSFALPLQALPPSTRLSIDPSRGGGCWLVGPGTDDQAGDDVMLLALAEREELLNRLVWGAAVERYSFATRTGFREMPKRYRLCQFTYWCGASGLTVCFVAELEAC